MTVFYFGSDGCTQCRALKKELEKTSIKYVEMPEESFDDYKISVLPTLILINYGEEEITEKVLTGFHTKEQLLAWVN